MKTILKEFGEWLLVRKGIGEITIRGYRACLQAMFRRIATTEPTTEQVEKYIVWMYEKKYSHSHITNTSLAIEWYFKWRGKHLKLGRPRKPKTIIKDVLTEAEVTRLIYASKNCREKAIISLLAYSGIRNRELCQLRVCDIDIGDNLLRILGGKGKRDRLIHISGDCSRIVLEYLTKHQRTPEDYLFTTMRGLQYTEWALRRLTKVLCKRTTIQKRVYPHLIRHSLATNLLRRGCHLNLIQRQLGHADITSTMVYARSFPQRLQQQYHLYIPSYI